MQMDVHLEAGGPLLVFGGPYSNLQATSAIWATANRLGIPTSHAICTGDVVAYCAQPEETIGLIRDWGCHVIQGNCDENLAERAPDCGCGFDEGTACDFLSKGWYPFADRQISDDSRRWMQVLPKSLTFGIEGRRARFIHGGFSENNRFIFASTLQAVKLDEFLASGADIIIAGHCGIPFMQMIADKVWFNPGVVGMPANDGTPDGWYGLIEPSPDRLKFSIHRLAYDAETAAACLRETGSAPAYSEALLSGRWPSLDVLPEAERAAAGSPLAETSMTLTTRPKAKRGDHRPSHMRQAR